MIKKAMGCLIEKLVFKKGHDKLPNTDKLSDLWSMPINDIKGKSTTLNAYRDNKKAFIFVNVACK